ncbi:YchJ family protein [Candidatus Leptofilum sp.]|uniref:YchJ family protein n=1 Tax=Candidatus Leptofilum sp. TaxID=3241576 RepID=UPI003B5CEB3E
MNQPCPCHSERPYTNCCQPIHLGKTRPSPAQLMRARYAAYALGNVRFILQTERPNPPLLPKEMIAKRRSLKQFCQNTRFLGLKILDEAALDDNQATITFRAMLLQGGQDASFTEQSLFELRNGRWVYVSSLS